MHTELQAVFNEHQTPTHCSKREFHDMSRAILAIGAKAQQQTAKYRELLLNAELAEHDHGLDGRSEAVQQKLNAIDKKLPEFIRLGRAVAGAFTELERELSAAHAAITQYEADLEKIA